jgi:beta-galactosidase
MHGGTNFGFHAGANGLTRETYAPCTTSYDFDAPIDEAGDLTPKFDCVRTVVAKASLCGKILNDEFFFSTSSCPATSQL